jgi:hypothetical protein
MARRSALEAVLGALGGGFSGYAKDQQVRYGQEQDTLDREERRKRELADALAAAEQRKISLFQSGLEEAAPLTERAGNMGRASQAVQAVSGMQAPGMPVGMSAVSRALAGASSGMTNDISRGRKLSVDGTDYVQPFSRTPDGRAERERMQAASDDRVEAMRQGERDARLGELRLSEIGEQGRQARLTQAERPVPFDPRANEGWRGSLPAASKTRLEQAESALNQLAYLKQAITENPDAVGAKNYVPGAFIDRLDPKGADIRSTIELIAGEIRNARFGGALTKTEAEFALRSLPDASQRADVVLSRINALERFLEERRRGVFNTYGQTYTPFETTDLREESGDSLSTANQVSVTGGSAADRLRSGRYP